MRILTTTTGFPGHVLPVALYARAAAAAGHEVCVVGPPPTRTVVEAFGLACCESTAPAPDEVGRIVARAGSLPPEEGHACMMAEGFARTATRAALRDLLQLVGAWRPEVVVRESHEFAGLLAAERHGIAHVRVALGPQTTETTLTALAAAPVQELRDEIGLPTDPDGEQIHAAPTFTLMPPTLDQADGAVASAHRFREEHDAAVPLPDWWPGRADPLVYVTFGSVAGHLGYFPGLYRRVCEALEAVDARVLVTVGMDSDPAALGPVPENVHVERWVEQRRIAAQADAVVCHGGHGSLVGALSFGRPLVVMPLFGADQRANAERVAELGAGVAVANVPPTMFAPPDDAVMAALPAAVGQVLGDRRFEIAAQRVRAEIAELPPVASAAGVLEAIAAAHAPTE